MLEDVARRYLDLAPLLHQGTITAFAAMAQKLPAYEPARIHTNQSLV